MSTSALEDAALALLFATALMAMGMVGYGLGTTPPPAMPIIIMATPIAEDSVSAPAFAVPERTGDQPTRMRLRSNPFGIGDRLCDTAGRRACAGSLPTYPPGPNPPYDKAYDQ